MKTEDKELVIRNLKDGIDLTISELSNLGNSVPKLISLLADVWSAGDARRLMDTRCGSMYLRKTSENQGNASLVISLRFPLEEKDR